MNEEIQTDETVIEAADKILQEGPMDYDELLKDLLSDLDQQEADSVKADLEKSTITDELAEYYTRRYNECVGAKNTIEEVAKRRKEIAIQRIDNWVERQVKPLDYTMNYLAGALELYAREHMKGKSKSVAMENGTLSFRKSAPSYECNDEEVRGYLRDKHLDLYLQQLDPKIKYSELKKAGKIIDGHLYLDDEMIAGISVTENPDKFYVK